MGVEHRSPDNSGDDTVVGKRSFAKYGRMALALESMGLPDSDQSLTRGSSAR